MVRTIIVCLLSLAAASLVSPDAEVLFEDPFTDLHNWNAPGQWSIEDGALVVTEGDIRTCKAGQEWTNYALEFDVTLRKLMAEWVIRAASEKDCCFIQLTAKDCPYSPNSLRYHRWKDGRLVEIAEDGVPEDIELGKTYHVRCEVVGHTAQTLINGKVRGSWSFDGYDRGTIGFRAGGEEQAAYRNLKVLRCEALTPMEARRQVRRKPQQQDSFLNPSFRGEWIWGQGESLDRAFRYTFDAESACLDARIWVTADNAFRLYVNGKEVGDSKDWYAPQTFDLKPYVRRGKNVVAVAAHNDGPGAAGVLAEGNVLLANGKNIPLVSDAEWRTSDAPPQDWNTPDFDDADSQSSSGWVKATSLGQHPQDPWGGQVDWRLPYLGPLEIAEAESLEVDSPLRRNKPVRITARFRLSHPFTQPHPARLSVRLSNGHDLVLATSYPQPPTTDWRVGSNRVQMSVMPEPYVGLSAGRYQIRLELVGVHIAKGAGRLQREIAWSPVPRRQPLPLSKRPMSPGLFTDQFGGVHHYRFDGSSLVYDAQRLAPIEHGDGAYWCVDDPQNPGAIEACRSGEILERTRSVGLTEEPVRVRLVDAIECADPESEAAHEFSEDDGYGGKSRLLKVGDRPYRVTDNRRKLSYFAYTMRCRTAGKPHLLVFETPNDRERYTLVRIQPPWRNVGCGPYTGRDMPCDDKPYQAGFVFYPEEESVRLTVSRLPCELKIDPESGGAVSRLWLFEIMDDLANRRAEAPPAPGPRRHIGLALTHPGYLYELYGLRAGDLSERLASLNAFADYADFVGMNYLEYNAIDGGDTSRVAYYPSQVWPQSGGDADLFREFLPLAEERGFGVVPCLTSLALDIEKFSSAPWISPLTFQIDRDGWRRRDFFPSKYHALPDPLRPEVQKVFLDTLREFGEQCKKSPAVLGLAFRLNGKIGTCYLGYNEDEQAATAGYSPWNLSEFQKDTGVHVPDWEESLIDRWVAACKEGRREDPAIQYIPKTYEWLRANCWKEWIDWRCRRLTDLWLRARDQTLSFRKDWNFVFKCDMPSETPDRNILWPAGESALELMRVHGFDPRLFAKEQGVLLQQGYFLGGGEYFQCYGPASPYSKNPEAWTAFDYQPGLAELYRTPAGASVELYHDYWEEFGVAKMGEFRTNFWGAGMMYPRGRYFFRPLVHALRTNNVHTIALFSWERGSEGHEGELRRFCRAFRALPAVEPKEFEGKVEVASGPPADETLWVRRFGSRIAVVNESPHPRTVRLTLGRAPSARGLYEYATQRKLAKGGSEGSSSVVIELNAFDLRVVGVE